MVYSQTIALGIAVGEEAALQHLVRRKSYAWDYIGRIERRLLHISEIVLRIAVELHHAHLDEGVIAVVPDLGQVEGMIGAGQSILLRHDLDEQLPAGIVPPLDALIEVALMALSVPGHYGLRLFVGQVLDALLGDPVELDPEALALSVDHAEGMAAESVHMAIGVGYAAVAHGDGDLVQSILVRGSRLTAWLRSGNLRGSLRKKTGVLFPTRSQFPSSV